GSAVCFGAMYGSPARAAIGWSNASWTGPRASGSTSSGRDSGSCVGARPCPNTNTAAPIRISRNRKYRALIGSLLSKRRRAAGFLISSPRRRCKAGAGTEYQVTARKLLKSTSRRRCPTRDGHPAPALSLRPDGEIPMRTHAFGWLALAAVVGGVAALAMAADKDRDTTDADFVYMATGGGAFEVRSSALALEKGSSDDVKKFAQRMVDDHTKATREL